MNAATNRIVIPEVDNRGRFRLEARATTTAVICIGCGCDELHACIDASENPCRWIAVDEGAGLGLCSECASKPIEELLDREHV
jgi:hypothetical protein